MDFYWKSIGFQQKCAVFSARKQLQLLQTLRLTEMAMKGGLSARASLKAIYSHILIHT